LELSYNRNRNLKFSTACVVSLDGTSGALGASVGIGKAGGLGYEE